MTVVFFRVAAGGVVSANVAWLDLHKFISMNGTIVGEVLKSGRLESVFVVCDGKCSCQIPLAAPGDDRGVRHYQIGLLSRVCHNSKTISQLACT